MSRQNPSKSQGYPLWKFFKISRFSENFLKFSEMSRFWGQPKLTLGARSHRDRAPTVSLGKNFQKFSKNFQKFSKNFQILENFQKFSNFGKCSKFEQILENAQNLSKSWNIKIFSIFLQKIAKIEKPAFLQESAEYLAF